MGIMKHSDLDQTHAWALISFQLISELDLDHVTTPTTSDGLRSILPACWPIRLMPIANAKIIQTSSIPYANNILRFCHNTPVPSTNRWQHASIWPPAPDSGCILSPPLIYLFLLSHSWSIPRSYTVPFSDLAWYALGMGSCLHQCLYYQLVIGHFPNKILLCVTHRSFSWSTWPIIKKNRIRVHC